MAVTVSGTSITFNDATVQTTAATAATTAQVLNATAGASLGAVGTYAFLSFTVSSSSTLNPGATVAGSSVRYAGGISFISASVNGVGVTAPAGTWRAMGFINSSNNCGQLSQTGTVCLRIS